MIKKITLAAFLLLIIKVASSQILIALVFGDKLNNEKLEFGLNIGANYSDIINLNHQNNNVGLNMGLFFAFEINKRLYFNPSLYFAYPMGARGLDIYESSDSNLNELLSRSTVNRNLTYFSMPLVLRYRIFGKTFFELGPQISLNSKAQDQFNVTIVDKNDLVYTYNQRDNYKYFDAGITVGFTQKLREKNGVNLTFRYYYGLMDISKNNKYPNQHNSVFYFSCGIPIGGNKKGEKDKL